MSPAAIVAWVVASGWRKIAAGAAVLAAGWLAWAIWDAGYQTAEQACDAAAAKAEVARLKTQLGAAKNLAESAQATARRLQEQDATAQERHRELQSEIEILRAAGRPGGAAGKGGKGGKSGPGLLDGRCDLTDRGVRFFSR
ncbi:hypothetical protein CH338_15775 [Rhodoplanes elegans]|uniref:Uncharacterized protein n=1 Tax=Rhodoplanes elegans TaxID=29408 RepID=A0A327KJ68_9BRAD|nr:hypothetical protein [Rhodoplanes elegans]RAI37535.1 hypothetical protein CH338_15775 [Rhodoplanes elegans]